MRVAEIKRICALAMGRSRAEMESPDRSWRIAHDRQIAMTLCWYYSRRNLSEVGRQFRRDHSTVIYARRTVERRCAANAAYLARVATLCALIEADIAAAARKATPNHWRLPPKPVALLAAPGKRRRRAWRRAVETMPNISCIDPALHIPREIRPVYGTSDWGWPKRIMVPA